MWPTTRKCKKQDISDIKLRLRKLEIDSTRIIYRKFACKTLISPEEGRDFIYVSNKEILDRLIKEFEIDLVMTPASPASFDIEVTYE